MKDLEYNPYTCQNNPHKQYFAVYDKAEAPHEVAGQLVENSFRPTNYKSSYNLSTCNFKLFLTKLEALNCIKCRTEKLIERNLITYGQFHSSFHKKQKLLNQLQNKINQCQKI